MGRNTNLVNLHKLEIVNNTKTFIVLFFACSILFFVGVDRILAASIYFSPSSGSYSADSSFSVNVLVGSSDQAMNAVSGTISFPADKLEVISISKSNTILNLWVQEPTFSNSAGTINFEGISLNPGFIGSSGNVLTVTFKAKSSGTAYLTFPLSSVLANDGQGTDILSTLGNAQFTIKSTTIPEPVPVPTPLPNKKDLVVLTVDESAVIISATHPNSNNWYSDSSPMFSWNELSDVIELKTLVGSRPNSKPIVLYNPPISEKLVEDLPDGEWYFHLRFRDSSGWGDVSHFKFNIDTERPESFEIREIKRESLTDPRVKFVFDAEDETSGIDYYKINIDGIEQEDWREDNGYIYTTNALGFGTHTLIAKAVDKAGNSRSNSIEFEIDPLWPPAIEEYPHELEVGKPLTVHGDAMYENIKVAVWLQQEDYDPKMYEVMSDDEGLFIFTLEDKLESGTYTLWAVVKDEKDAKSDSSDKVTIKIKKVSLLTIGSVAVSVLAVIIPLVVLIIFLVFLLWYGWNKFNIFRSRVRRKVKHTESTVHKAFKLLRSDIEEHIKVLKKVKSKRTLTKSEQRMIDSLDKSLEEAEIVLQEEVGSIGKVVNSTEE